MQYDFGYSVEDGIATLTFNRPDVLNALTLDIYAHALPSMQQDAAAKLAALLHG